VVEVLWQINEYLTIKFSLKTWNNISIGGEGGHLSHLATPLLIINTYLLTKYNHLLTISDFFSELQFDKSVFLAKMKFGKYSAEKKKLLHLRHRV